MDAKEFIREVARICAEQDGCFECPINGSRMNRDGDSFKCWNDEIVDIVEQWSKEHPVITNADKLKEVISKEFHIPLENVTIDAFTVSCCTLLRSYDCRDGSCESCPYNDFWMKPYHPLKKN